MGKMIKITIGNKEFKNLKECAKEYGINYKKLYYIYYSNDKKLAEEDIIKLQRKEKNINKKENDYDINIENEISSKSIILSGSINSLFDCIREYKPKIINLIDFENLCREDLSDYLVKDSFNIFFYNACIYSNNFYKLIKQSKSINFQVITFNTANQLIDKILLFYLGALSSRFDIKYNIIAKDYGYLTFINSICSEDSKNISIKGIEIEPDKELQFVKTMCTYLTDKVKSGKYYISDEIKFILKPWYLKRNAVFTDKDLNHLIDLLKKYGCLSIINRKFEQQFLFIISKIDELSF